MAKFIELHRKLPNGHQNVNGDKSIKVLVSFELKLELYNWDGSTIVNDLGKHDGYIESPEQIIAKINEPDSELIEAVRELVDGIHVIGMDFKNPIEKQSYLSQLGLVEKLLEEL